LCFLCAFFVYFVCFVVNYHMYMVNLRPLPTQYSEEPVEIMSEYVFSALRTIASSPIIRP